MFNLSRLLLVALLAMASAVAAETKAEPPVPVRTVKPVYPEDMRRDGVAGMVMLKCTVDEHGNVNDVEVVKTSHESFTQPALDALRRWKFKPARQDGNAVAVKINIPIRFAQEG